MEWGKCQGCEEYTALNDYQVCAVCEMDIEDESWEREQKESNVKA